MLMAQIQYQDPLDPMENTEFTAQLAQINTVSQLQGVNENLTYLQLYMASINNSQSVNFIGKEVIAAGNSVHLDENAGGNIRYSLGADAAKVSISIYDANGKLINTLYKGSQTSGPQTVYWDGTDSNGNALAEGNYTFKVYPVDLNDDAVDVTTMLTGVVDGITFENGVTYLTVDDQNVAIGDVIEIGDNVAGTSTKDYLAMIGKEVTASSEQTYYDGDNQPRLFYSLGSDAENVSVKVYDTEGNLVKTIDCGKRIAGTQYCDWDGTDESGTEVAAGTYLFKVSASDSDGRSVNSQSLVNGTVDSITYDAEKNAYAVIGQLLIPVDDIIEIKDSGSSSFRAVADFIKDVGSMAVRAAPLFL